MEKVILTPLDVEATELRSVAAPRTCMVRTWEARYAPGPQQDSPEYLRWLRGYGTSQEEAVASLLHARYVEQTELG